MEEPDGFFAMRLPEDFPSDDLRHIQTVLVSCGGLVPGYVPPDVGMLNMLALFYAEEIEGLRTILLPDRNLVSRMASVARGGLRRPFDHPTAIAVNLMAFAQCMGLDIEPSVAFHELAFRKGNQAAREELGWFRAADQAQAVAWVDIARGRRNQLEHAQPHKVPQQNFAYPLSRWQRNYVVALKIAELELTPMPHVLRATTLLDWMVKDFFLAGPGALFAMMYFSPLAQRRRLMKHVRSTDRERAIEGAKNAAWDITHLSDFSARAKRCEAEQRRYIFASADKGLAAIASVLLVDAEEEELAGEFERMLVAWWKAKDAELLAQLFSKHIRAVAGRPPPTGPKGNANPIPKWIREGEARIRAWQPAA